MIIFLRENRGFLADIWTPGKMRRKDGERGKNCKRKYTNAMIILNLREEDKKTEVIPEWKGTAFSQTYKHLQLREL
jgi:hypothetical protein